MRSKLIFYVFTNILYIVRNVERVNKTLTWRYNVMGIKRLEELFPEDFFETDLIGLSENEKTAMKSIEISEDDYFIDLDKILKALNISVQKGFYNDHSGQN